MAADQKYGPHNLDLGLADGDIVIRIDPKGISHNLDGTERLAGTPNPTPSEPGKLRKVDLIGTTSGFTTISGCKVSVNVTR